MIVDLNEGLYSYEKYLDDVKKMEKKYEDLIKCVTIGQSHDNRDIILLKLGYGRRYFTISSGVHGRETINPIVILALIEYYADIYANYKEQKAILSSKLKDFNVHLGPEYDEMILGVCIYELLQTFTILFVPLLNPDGYMISLKGFDQIRDEKLREKCLSKNIPHREWKYNGRGVDINRNFPSRLWRPKNSEDYVASENETIALISVFHDYKSKGFIDFHSRGKSIYYYRKEMSNQYNERQLIIGEKLKEITGYELVQPQEEIEEGDTGGNTVHYFSEHFFRPALTIETVDDEATFPLEQGYRQITYDEIKLVFLQFGGLII